MTTQQTCKIQGCEKPVHRVNLCMNDYIYWLENGVLSGPVKNPPEPIVRGGKRKYPADWTKAQKVKYWRAKRKENAEQSGQ